MKNNHTRVFHSQNSIMMVMNSVRHLNKLNTMPKKIAHLIHLKRFNGVKFVESVLSVPELNHAHNLKQMVMQPQTDLEIKVTTPA